MEGAGSSEAKSLHPFTLVQRLLVSVPGFLLILIPLLRSSDRQAWLTVLFAVAYGFVALPLILLQFYRFRYRITPNELVIQSGVLTRQHRSIPVERIQNIEIEQKLLSRLLGIAKVSVETAGSTSTEGVLEYVSLEDAHQIRASIRQYQRQQEQGEPDPAKEHSVEPASAGPLQAPGYGPTPAEAVGDQLLFSMTLSRVLLSGAFRFSLVYIALIFTLLEYLDLRPEELADWIMRGRLQVLHTVAEHSPWVLALASIGLAAFLAWLTGILIQLNKFYGFKLWAEGGKLHTRHGLLTVAEGTIPLKKIQALILRTNPLMQRFGWYTLELQTIGLDARHRGPHVAIPFAQLPTILAVVPQLYAFSLPDDFLPVSPLHMRRLFIRYAVLLLAAVLSLAFVFTPALWALGLLPVLLYLAWLQYRHHRFATDETHLFIERGALRRRLWILPVEKFQVLYLSASLFQRRLGLTSVYVDTAGDSTFHAPGIADVGSAQGTALLSTLYARLKASFHEPQPSAISVTEAAGSSDAAGARSA